MEPSPSGRGQGEGANPQPLGKRLKLALAALLAGVAAPIAPALAYAHVVVVILENRDFADVIANRAAPYVNGVLTRRGAVLTNSIALSHPSQPNYLQLFSGSPQTAATINEAVPGSLAPAGAPATGAGLDTPNLGAAVRQAGGTYATYSESLSLGADPLAYEAGGRSGQLYVRKHNPGSNWIAANPVGNQLPASTNQDFAAFKATPLAELPTLAFVIPNECNDAHGLALDCNYRHYDRNTADADTWLRRNMDRYAKWARSHDSLLILTADEGIHDIATDPVDGQGLTRVPTVIVGAGIATRARYAGRIDTYGLCAFIAGAVGAQPPGQCAAPESQAQAAALAHAIGARLKPASP